MAENTLSNILLEQARQEFINSVPSEKKAEYNSYVTAGLKVMTDKKTSQFLQERLNRSNGDIVSATASGLADLMVMLYHESKQALTADMAIMVAFELMTHALEIAEKSGVAKVTNDILEQATEATWKSVAQKFGVSQEQIDQYIADHSGDQEPQQQGLLNAKGV